MGWSISSTSIKRVGPAILPELPAAAVMLGHHSRLTRVPPAVAPHREAYSQPFPAWPAGPRVCSPSVPCLAWASARRIRRFSYLRCGLCGMPISSLPLVEHRSTYNVGGEVVHRSPAQRSTMLPAVRAGLPHPRTSTMIGSVRRSPLLRVLSGRPITGLPLGANLHRYNDYSPISLAIWRPINAPCRTSPTLLPTTAGDRAERGLAGLPHFVRRLPSPAVPTGSRPHPR